MQIKLKPYVDPCTNARRWLLCDGGSTHPITMLTDYDVAQLFEQWQALRKEIGWDEQGQASQ